MLKYSKELFSFFEKGAQIVAAYAMLSAFRLGQNLARFMAFVFLGNQALTSSPSLFLTVMISVVALNVLESVWTSVVCIFEARQRSNALGKLQKRIMRTLTGANSSFWDSHESGDIVNRVQNNASQTISFLDPISMIIFGLPSSLCLIVVAMAYDFRLCLLSFAFSMLGQYVLSERLTRRIGQASKSVQEAIDSSLQVIIEGIRAIPGNRWFAGNAQVASRFMQMNNTVYEKKIEKATLDNRRQMLNELFGYISSFVFIALGSYLCYRKEISLGVFLAIYSLKDQFTIPITLITQFRAAYKENQIYKNRVNEVLDTVQEEAPKNEVALSNRPFDVSAATAIEFSHVRFAYNSKSNGNSNDYVLNDFNCIIGNRQIAAIRGPSGSGKSSVFKLLMGFYMPQDGEIMVYGQRLTPEQITTLRKTISYIPQSNYIFNDTVLDNIRIANPNASKADVEHAAKGANIHDFIETLDHGYDTILTNNAQIFSAGQHQRIAIARAFLKNSPIVLMDEITSHLDVESERLIILSLRKLLEGKTALIISHNESFDIKMDQIIQVGGK